MQLYLEAPVDDRGRPLRILAGFATVALRRDFRQVRLKLPARLFARFDEPRRAWAWLPGTYRLRAGRSSRDLRVHEAEVVLG